MSGRLTIEKIRELSGGDVRKAIGLLYPPMAAQAIISNLDMAADPAHAEQQLRKMLGLCDQEAE